MTTSTSTTSESDSQIALPIRMIGKVSRGFGRGSKDLGIPTANLDRDSLQSSTPFDYLPTGIYWGFGRIVVASSDTFGTNSRSTYSGGESNNATLVAAISVGYNPTYGNDRKSIEPHLIAAASDPRRHASSTGETLLEDFYDRTCRLSLVGYLRPELPFEGLEKLVDAIKNDIVNSETFAVVQDPKIRKEEAWVGSNDPV